VDLSPKRSSAWVGLGNNAWARGEIKPALDFYLMGFGADPKNYEASYNVALAYRQLGDQAHADEYFLIAHNLHQATSSH
jgi:Tfp pilus assembly protein PilF